MVALTSLWLPILLAAIAVFLVSSVFHVMLPWHRADHDQLPNEDKALAALRDAGVGAGNYAFPHCSGKDWASEEMKAKWATGPAGFLTVLRPGPPAMGKQLGLWFVYCLIVGVFVAYLASHALAAGAHYLKVFQIVGTAAFMGYGIGAPLDSVWKGAKWSASARFLVDGVVYGLLTAGIFGWLWPAA